MIIYSKRDGQDFKLIFEGGIAEYFYHRFEEIAGIVSDDFNYCLNDIFKTFTGMSINEAEAEAWGIPWITWLEQHNIGWFNEFQNIPIYWTLNSIQIYRVLVALLKSHGEEIEIFFELEQNGNKDLVSFEAWKNVKNIIKNVEILSRQDGNHNNQIEQICRDAVSELQDLEEQILLKLLSCDSN